MELALSTDDSDYLRMLLEYGGDPNQRVGEGTTTVIYQAVMYNQIVNVRLLIEAGANLNHQDSSGKTPMLTAANINNYDMIFFFLEHGADPTIKNRWGYDLPGKIKLYADRAMEFKQYRWYLLVVEELKSRGLIESDWNPVQHATRKEVEKLRKQEVLP